MNQRNPNLAMALAVAVFLRSRLSNPLKVILVIQKQGRGSMLKAIIKKTMAVGQTMLFVSRVTKRLGLFLCQMASVLQSQRVQSTTVCLVLNLMVSPMIVLQWYRLISTPILFITKMRQVYVSISAKQLTTMALSTKLDMTLLTVFLTLICLVQLTQKVYIF